MSKLMTRQHYELIAHVLKSARASEGRNQYASRTNKVKSAARLAALESLTRDFSSELASTNGRFDRERFERACDPAGEYTDRSRASRRRNPISQRPTLRSPASFGPPTHSEADLEAESE